MGSQYKRYPEEHQISTEELHMQEAPQIQGTKITYIIAWCAPHSHSPSPYTSVRQEPSNFGSVLWEQSEM